MTIRTTRAALLAASAFLGAMALDPVSGFNVASAAECNENTAQIDGHQVITGGCDTANGIATYEVWRKDGKLDRADGPAIIARDAATGTVTYEAWFKDGKLIEALWKDGKPIPARLRARNASASTSVITGKMAVDYVKFHYVIIAIVKYSPSV